MENAMVDATAVKVHRHGQGVKGTKSQATDHSKGGMTLQDPRAEGRSRQPRSLRALTGTAPRYHWRRTTDRGDRVRRVARRQGLRQQ